MGTKIFLSNTNLKKWEPKLFQAIQIIKNGNQNYSKQYKFKKMGTKVFQAIQIIKNVNQNYSKQYKFKKMGTKFIPHLNFARIYCSTPTLDLTNCVMLRYNSTKYTTLCCGIR